MALVRLSGRSKNSHFVHLFLASFKGLFVSELFRLGESAFRKTGTHDERAGHKPVRM